MGILGLTPLQLLSTPLHVPATKLILTWAIATDKDLIDYKYLTRIYCKNIHVDDVVKCSDVNCKSHDP